MCGLAVAQPIFSVLGANTADLVSRRLSIGEVVVFALLVVTVPPAVLLGVEELVRLVRPRAVAVVHPTLLGLAMAAAVLQFVGDGDVRSPVVLLTAAAAAGVALGYFATTKAGVRLWLRYLAVAPVLFLVSFLVLSPVRRVVFAPRLDVVAAPEAADRPDVVVVLLDELPTLSLLRPDGSIDAERFPAFAELASMSTWYRDTTTTSTWTTMAAPSIFTGRYPDPDTRPVAVDHPQSLYTLLGGAYDRNVHESVTLLCPESLCPPASPGAGMVTHVRDLIGLAAGVLVDRTTPGAEAVDVQFFSPTATGVGHAAVFEDFIASIEPGARPTLNVAHIGLPHQPWTLTPSTQPHNGPPVPPGLPDGVAWSDDLAAAAGRQAHLLNLEATDHLVGELLEHLRAVDMLEDTMLVVMADHGVAFVGGEPFRAATEATVDQVAYPPLFIKEPGQRVGAVSDLPAEVVDVVPTIADVAGIPIPWAVDGTSLRDPEAVQASPRAFHPLFRDRLPATSSGTVELRDSFDARLARNEALVASGADEVALGSLPGSPANLVGRAVDDLAVESQSDVVVSVGPGDRDLLVSDDAPIPAFVEVQLDRGGGRTLAVALDGRVVLAGATTPDGGLWGYLPIDRLTPGTHRVDVYVVAEGATEPALAPVAS